jgi:esterase/lipase
VSSDNIFILGQSLGGMMAPKIAELRPQVKGIISFAGPSRKLVDLLYDQYTMVCEESNQEKMTYEYRDKVINDIKNITAEYDDMAGAEINDDMTEEEKAKMEEYRVYRAYSDTYWLSCHNFDIEESLSKINVPMLIMQGESDVNVLADKDYVEWQRLLAGRDNCHFKLYPGLNHVFKVQKYPGFLNNIKDYSEPGRIESYVTDDIAEFIHQYTAR